jgi:hypothetical protein
MFHGVFHGTDRRLGIGGLDMKTPGAAEPSQAQDFTLPNLHQASGPVNMETTRARSAL